MLCDECFERHFAAASGRLICQRQNACNSLVAEWLQQPQLLFTFDGNLPHPLNMGEYIFTIQAGGNSAEQKDLQSSA